MDDGMLCCIMLSSWPKRVDDGAKQDNIGMLFYCCCCCCFSLSVFHKFCVCFVQLEAFVVKCFGSGFD